MAVRILKWLLVTVFVLVIGFEAFYQYYFLRLPLRNVPNIDNEFVSPANGVVASVTHWNADSLVIPKGNWGAIKVLANDLGDSGTMVCITLNLANVHYQRAPIAGSYIGSTYTEGAFHNALKHDNQYGMRFENEHNTMLFASKKGTRYKVIQIAGFAARRIVDSMADKPGQSIYQGEVIGLIKFGSQVTVLFPGNVNVKVHKGDILIDGETILGVEL